MLERNRAVTLGLLAMLAPAIVGAILGWPWWVVYAAMVPSAVWLIDNRGISGVAMNRGRRDGMENRSAPLAQMLPLFIVATVYASRFSGLLVSAGFMIAFVTAWLSGRRDVKRKDNRGRPVSWLE